MRRAQEAEPEKRNEKAIDGRDWKTVRWKMKEEK